MRYLMVLVVATCLSACVGPKSSYTPIVQNISRPSLGELHSAAVGEEMLAQGTLAEVEGVELEQQNQIGGYTLSPGFYPMTADDGDVTYHAYRNGSPIGDGFGALKVGFLMDPPKNIQASRSEQKICVVTAFGLKTCDTEHVYRRKSRPVLSDNHFQQTLIYNGKSGSKINVAYREFSGSVARPAFSNAVEYDLSESNIIAYRGARIRIVDATNEAITYEVLSNFNSGQ
ncbi:MAG: hypothetical protein JKY75_07850 [Erythrobacter sp.]|nr:hypothetical protein [Erythrobacter sp.]